MDVFTSVIIPAYNEEGGIGDTIKELFAYEEFKDNLEVIVVNDGSKDKTLEVLQSLAKDYPNLKVLNHKVNKGYGSAIKTGIKEAKGDYIAWYDADGQHRPEDLHKVIRKVVDDELDYVIGIRDGDSYEDPNRKLGKRVLKWIVNFWAIEKTMDFNSGLRIFRRDILLRCASLLPKRFGASTVTTLLMQELDYVGDGVLINVRKRVGTSSVKQFRDGFRTISLILNVVMLFRPMQIFGSLGFLMIFAGGIYGLIEALTKYEGFSVLAAIIMIFGIQMVVFGTITKQISQLRISMIQDYFSDKNSKS